MFRSLLVALDGTPFGEFALPLAMRVAQRTGATLNLVHVRVPVIDLGSPRPTEEPDYLSGVAATVAAHAPEIQVSCTVLDGGKAECLADPIAAHAEKIGIDLIVLNSHARGGLSRWWLGNVADDLVHRTSIPLLIAPDLEDHPGWEMDSAPRHILVGLDGTPLAEQILPAALALGSCTEAEFTLLRIVEPVTVPVVDPVCAPAAAYDAGLVERQQAAAEAYLTRTANRLREQDSRLTVHTRAVLDADPADGICGYLRLHASRTILKASEGAERPVDMIALATHGREGLARLLLGSVSDRVLQHSPVPLLIQRPLEKRPRVGGEGIDADLQPLSMTPNP